MSNRGSRGKRRQRKEKGEKDGEEKRQRERWGEREKEREEKLVGFYSPGLCSPLQHQDLLTSLQRGWDKLKKRDKKEPWDRGREEQKKRGRI